MPVLVVTNGTGQAMNLMLKDGKGTAEAMVAEQRSDDLHPSLAEQYVLLFVTLSII